MVPETADERNLASVYGCGLKGPHLKGYIRLGGPSPSLSLSLSISLCIGYILVYVQEDPFLDLPILAVRSMCLFRCGTELGWMTYLRSGLESQVVELRV